jgi:restriction system protein
MGRRRNRELDFAMSVAQVVALVGVGVAFFPPFRNALLSLGYVLLGAAIVIGIVAVGVLLIRRSARKSVWSGTAPTAPMLRGSPPRVTQLDAITSVQRATVAPVVAPAVVPARPSQARTATTAELIHQLRAIDWFQFEKLVALVYRKLGYSVTRRGGANPDGGIDLVIQIYGQRAAVQCKHWRTRDVGVRAVREFLGALTDAGIQKGVFITLCGYTVEAKQLAEKHGIEIVNEIGLALMLESTDARFDPETLSILYDTRKFCPKCERELVLRTAKKGLGAGRQFWGCSTYPRCKFTMPVCGAQPETNPSSTHFVSSGLRVSAKYKT